MHRERLLPQCLRTFDLVFSKNVPRRLGTRDASIESTMLNTGSTVFVCNLAPETPSRSLRALFVQNGFPVQEVVVPDTKRSRQRCAFVSLRSPLEARAAQGRLNGIRLDSRPLVVRYVKLRGDQVSLEAREPRSEVARPPASQRT